MKNILAITILIKHSQYVNDNRNSKVKFIQLDRYTPNIVIYNIVIARFHCIIVVGQHSSISVYLSIYLSCFVCVHT